jgi:hypothetical protein
VDALVWSREKMHNKLLQQPETQLPAAASRIATDGLVWIGHKVGLLEQGR